MGHLNGGVGFNQSSIAVSLELANDLFGTSQMLHSAGAAIRWRARSVQPFAGLGLAFGDHFPSTLAMTVGVQGRL